MFKKIFDYLFKKPLSSDQIKYFESEFEKTVKAFETECSAEYGYFTGSRYRAWLSTCETLSKEYLLALKTYKPPKKMKEDWILYKESIQQADLKRNAFNDFYMDEEIKLNKVFFNSGQEKPLDVQQRRAVVCDEDNTLVLAGAGSGKTSVIAAKVAYLVKIKKVPTDQILLMTFGKKAAKEMSDRVLKEYGIKRINSGTIHALGKAIIDKVEGKKTLVLGDDKAAVQGSQIYIENEIYQNLLKENAVFSNRMNRFLNEFLQPLKTEWDFEKLEEWEAHISDMGGLITLSNDRVKSFEEKMIANYLFSHGISFKYEALYEVETATADKREYLPDFYLTDYQIYLEHFGVNKEGNPPPFFTESAKKDYVEGMKWKKQLHSENKTKLICTYSYMRQEGKLIQELEKLLVENGVQLEKHPVQFDKLIKRSDISEFISHVMKAFISLYKLSGYTVNELKEQLREKYDFTTIRSLAFLEVFEIFYEAYQKELLKLKMIDFGDMINRSCEYVEQDYSKWGENYKYIIVDEFQDTASGAVKLIRAIAAKNPGCKLYFVGDDWQSIYRFNGSDVSLIQKFEEIFQDGRIVDLGNNYRSLPNVVFLGEKFITRNPHQRKKSVSAIQTQTRKNYVIDANVLPLIEKFIKNACEWDHIETAKVFFLGRYNEDEPNYLETLKEKFKKLDISFMSIHKSKGLEADYVFFVPPKSLHFPSQESDDPILDLVAAPREKFLSAEERRLMYVAITRAKRQVFFIRPEHMERMQFFKEIEELLN
jgi:DNA helicase IV